MFVSHAHKEIMHTNNLSTALIWLSVAIVNQIYLCLVRYPSSLTPSYSGPKSPAIGFTKISADIGIVTIKVSLKAHAWKKWWLQMGKLLGLSLLCSEMMSLCYAALLIKCPIMPNYAQLINTTQAIPSIVTRVWACLEQEVMLPTVPYA